MTITPNPKVYSSLHISAGHMQACSFKEYEEQVTAYFSGRSGNIRLQCDPEKIKKRFENACIQMERFIDLPEKGE